MKYLLLGIVSIILGVAAGFYVCKQTYQPQVAELKEQVAAVTAELKTEKTKKEEVRVVFSHNAECVVGEVGDNTQ